MKFDVIFNNEKLQALPFASLVTYRTAFERMGFQTFWDVENRSLILNSDMNKKSVSLIVEEKNDEEKVQDIMEAFQKPFVHFVNHFGTKVYTDNDHINHVDLKMRFSVSMKHISSPNANINYNFGNSQLEQIFENYKESISPNLNIYTKKIQSGDFTPCLDIQFQIPIKHEEEWTDYVENLAIIMATYVCNNMQYQKGEGFHYLSKEFILPFLMNGYKDQDLPEKSTSYIEKNKLEKHQSDISQESSIQEDYADAEVFFNYTIHPSKGKDQFITIGELIIKNQGNMMLHNPLICLKVNPIELVDLGGQILPPDMANLFGVNTSEGMKGWRYLDKDWFKTAEERGEYWIAPIQPLEVAPDDTISLPNLQITIQRPNEDLNEKVTIQGAVYFHEQELSFLANNVIAFSF